MIYISGAERHLPPADISVYNPNGLDVEFRRAWCQGLALTGYGLGNLGPGWTHNWDVDIRHSWQGHNYAPWEPVTVRYPSGEVQPLIPVLDAQGRPTGELYSGYGGRPPVWFEGEPDLDSGFWRRITFHWACNTDWVFEADPPGEVLELRWLVVDQAQSVRFDRDRDANTLSIVDPLGWGSPATERALLTIHYGFIGQITSVRDCYDRVVIYEYAPWEEQPYYSSPAWVLSKVSPITDANDPDTSVAEWRYEYSADMFDAMGAPLLSRYRQEGAGTGATNLLYQGLYGRLSSETDPNGVGTYYEREPDSLKQTIRIRDATYHEVMSWDLQLNGEVVTGSTNPAEPKSVTYADVDHVSSVTDHDNRTASFAYDGHGNMTAVTDERGVTTTLTWDYTQDPHWGRLVQIQEGQRQPVTFSYAGPCSRVETITLPQPGSTDGSTVTYQFAYNALGDVTLVTGPGNNATATRHLEIAYTDAAHPHPKAGQPRRVVDQLGRAMYFDYDDRGNLVSVTDSGGRSTGYTYDLRDQLVEVQLPPIGEAEDEQVFKLRYTYRSVDGPVEKIELFRHVGVHDAPMGKLRYVYGPANELLSAELNDQVIATFSYDALYRLVSITDGAGHRTEYGYCSAGWLNEIRYPFSLPDGTGAVRATLFDPVGRILERVDGSGRVTRLQYNHAAGLLTDILYPSEPSSNVHIDYDLYGLPTATTDASGSRSWTYDAGGHLLSETTSYTGLPAQQVLHAFWPDGSLRSLTTPGGVLEYLYNAAGDPTSLVGSGGTTTWTYLADGRLGGQTLPSGASTQYLYDTHRMPNELVHRDPSGNIVCRYHGLRFDPFSAGRLTHWEVDVPAHVGLSGETNYGYDASGSLVAETSTRAGWYEANNAYDGAGNATQFRNSGGWLYNACNQLVSNGWRQWVWRADGTPEVYKAQDPMHASEVLFDPEQRLLGGIGTPTFGYRGDGLRAWKDVDGQRTWYLYSGTLLVGELNGAGTLSALHTWGPTGLVGRGADYYQFDLLGDVAVRLNSQGQALDLPVFDAWGNQRAGETNTYGYRGQVGYRLDPEAGLYLLTWRYYDPEIGRFVTRDPIGYAGGANLYAYLDDRPVQASDPLGLQGWEEALMAAVFGFGFGALFDLAAQRWRGEQHIDGLEMIVSGGIGALGGSGSVGISRVGFLSLAPVEGQAIIGLARLMKVGAQVALNAGLGFGLNYGGAVVLNRCGRRYSDPVKAGLMGAIFAGLGAKWALGRKALGHRAQAGATVTGAAANRLSARLAKGLIRGKGPLPTVGQVVMQRELAAANRIPLVIPPAWHAATAEGSAAIANLNVGLHF